MPQWKCTQNLTPPRKPEKRKALPTTASPRSSVESSSTPSCHDGAGEAATTGKSGTKRRSRVGQSWEEADRRGQLCGRVRTRLRPGVEVGVPSRNDKLPVGLVLGLVRVGGWGLKVHSFFVFFLLQGKLLVDIFFVRLGG